VAVQFTFVGTGDAFGSGGRFNTCFHVAAERTTFLIDCGATSLVALRKLGIAPDKVDVIFLSHLHGDHFGALPFIMLDAQFVTRRTKSLTIVGPTGTQDRLTQAMEVFFTGSSKIPWDFSLVVIEVQDRQVTTVNGVAVQPFEVEHPSGAPSHALRFGIDGRVLAYSGDTQWVDALIPASENADLFVCECHSYAKHVPYHINHTTLSEKRAELSAKRIVLTHMSDDMLGNRDKVDFETAYDGLVIDL
jgi:ribonuclease BN (tRNA processing enzyme)